ncbi:histone-lysine N-methyltransferase ATXR2 [Striga asiatica]|uniref:Histone-lysine N-methyltransferase ATXR2 n=1 Tax=Striga asiatica TaxID=4170 RepID=A0A5A7R639_STRAF|nr:histone-lysine N-methyltransferase ATXR2 [Striga asiatica]
MAAQYRVERRKAGRFERTSMEDPICPIDAKFAGQVSALLTPPPLHQEYYEVLVSERKCSRLRVKPESEHGKGVFSEVDFQEGDLVLKDQMLAGAQHSSNKIDCLVCSFCFRFIGSIELQIGRKLYLEELGIRAVDECGPSNDEGSCSSPSHKTRLPQDTIQSLMNGNLLLPYSEKFPLPSVVSCLGGCLESHYCSQSCAEADWDLFHSLLCDGKGSSSPNTKALEKFTKHANETNDIFILAAKVISSTILRYRKLKVAQGEEKGKNDASCLNNNDISSFLLEAWKPVSMGFKRRWWECVALPEDVDSSSPVEDYFLFIDDLPLSQKKEAEKITKSFLDALGDDYSISCEGTAFFPLQSCMNHSCIPNAKAFKREEDKDGQATVIAQRPIRKGEEITISYIDEDLPYKERQESLADYGFTCKCPKCIEEES